MLNGNSEARASPDDNGVDWEAVRAAYELSGESVSAIGKRFGLTKHQLTKARIAGGWTPRPAAAKPGPLQGRKPVGSEALAFRLSRLLVIGVAMLEKCLADEGLTDKNARMLTELCRAEEIRMRSTRTKTAKTRETKKHDAGHDFRDDPAWLDAELDRRLERLRAVAEAGAAEGGGDADGTESVPGGMGELGAS